MGALIPLALGAVAGGGASLAGAGALTATLIGAGASSALLKHEAANKQEQAIQSQMTQQRVAEASRSIQRGKQLNQVIGSQQAIAASRGISLASGSFKGLTQRSFDSFHDDERADALNLSFRENALKDEQTEVRSKETAGIFGSIVDFGQDYFDGIGSF